MGEELRREYPILHPYTARKASLLTVGPLPGEDYTQAGEALFDLVWRRISGTTLDVATQLARIECTSSVELLETAKRHAEEASPPCPKPKPEGEMKAVVLLRSSSGAYYLPWLKYIGKPGYIGATILGRYEAPEGTCPGPYSTLAKALATIRDAGGTCLAGEPLPEPLPEPVVETWPLLHAGPHPYHCGHCLTGYSDRRSVCGYCKAKLDGVIPWDPTAYRNRGC